MKLGHLNTPSSGLHWETTAWRAGGKIPFPPAKTTSGTMRWNWLDTMRTDVELHIRFDTEVFASMIRLQLAGASSLTCARVFVPDECGEKAVGIHRAEDGKSFGKTVEIPVGVSADTFIIRMTPTMIPLEMSEPEILGAVWDQPLLYPTPASVQWDTGFLPMELLSLAADDEHPDSIFALSYYRTRLQETIDLYTIPASWRRSTPTPVSETPAAGCTAVRICHTDDLPADGYRLTVTEGGALLEASNRLGILYAVERLMEMTNADGVPCCQIEDIPYKEMRGFHFGLPPREEIPFLKKLLTTILIPYHYNQLIMEFAGGMRFDSHPEISEAWLEVNRKSEAGEVPLFPHGSMNSGGRLLEKDEVREFCNFARELGFELIPEVQSFGHVQYITYAHPDIAETDESVIERQMDTRSTDQPPSTYYHHSYCPQNPKSYAIIYDLIDEIVDVVKPPRFVHMGHDEIYQIGLCPKCKDMPHDELYEMHVTAMHSYLANKGLRMMIWADMLQPTERYKSWPAIERLPKDIVLLDFIWYFHFDLDMEDHLLPYGYDIIMGNLYSSHYPRYETRAAKQRMIGGQVSTWCRIDEYTLAKKGKLYDLLYTGEMLWSAAYRADCRAVYAKILADRIPFLRDRIRGLHGTKREYTPLEMPVSSRRIPLALKTACQDASLKAVCQYTSLTPVLLTEPVSIAVHSRKADALRFVHTTLHDEKRIAWTPLVLVGTYEVCYADGTVETIPVEYAGNVRCWNSRYADPLPEQYYRHQGYIATWFADPILQTHTDDGDPVTLLALEWVNPHPEKEITEIRCSEADTSAAGLVLCGVNCIHFAE